MNIIFRVDSYEAIGSGHLMRCLNLADQLSKSNNIWFLTIASHYSLELIKRRGYKLLPIENFLRGMQSKEEILNQDALKSISLIKENDINADLLIVDSYALDISWEKKLRNFTKKIFVIDDLANRKHSCDMLLDQNLFENMESRYKLLTQKNTELLLGPHYAILGKEFSSKRNNITFRSNNIKKVLISFGGVDEHNFTGKLIKHLQSDKFKDIHFDVAITDNFVFLDELISMNTPDNFSLHRNMDSLALLMKKNDIAIGAGGTTTWERLSMALPSIVITVSDNQVESIKLLNKMNLINWLGHYDSLRKTWLRSIDEAILANSQNKEMSEKSLSIVDGQGSKKVAKKIMKLLSI